MTLLNDRRLNSPHAAAARPAGARRARPCRARARAVVELNITQGTIQPLPIAIPTSPATARSIRRPRAEISDVVASDLRASGLFVPIDQAAFIEQGIGTGRVPRFEDWRVVNAQALVVGRIGAQRRQAQGRVQAVGRVRRQAARRRAVLHPAEGCAPHRPLIADAIYERITGEKGYFDTRIVFVDEFGPKGQAHEAPGHHGPGRLQRQAADHGPGPGADPALQPLDPGDHLHVLRGRRRRRSICSISRPGRRRSSAPSRA